MAGKPNKLYLQRDITLLKNLHLTNVSLPWELVKLDGCGLRSIALEYLGPDGFPASVLLHFLKNSPGLENLELMYCIFEVFDIPNDTGPVLLPNLASLKIRDDLGMGVCSILEYIRPSFDRLSTFKVISGPFAEYTSPRFLYTLLAPFYPTIRVIHQTSTYSGFSFLSPDTFNWYCKNREPSISISESPNIPASERFRLRLPGIRPHQAINWLQHVLGDSVENGSESQTCLRLSVHQPQLVSDDDFRASLAKQTIISELQVDSSAGETLPAVIRFLAESHPSESDDLPATTLRAFRIWGARWEGGDILAMVKARSLKSIKSARLMDLSIHIPRGVVIVDFETLAALRNIKGVTIIWTLRPCPEETFGVQGITWDEEVGKPVFR